MKLSPLCLLAALRVPSLTDIFSDVIPLTSMTVVAGNKITLTCSAPHAMPVGSQRMVCITDALTPNPITGLDLLDNGDVLVTVTYDHMMSTTPDATLWLAWDAFAHIAGTTVTGLEGNILLVSVPDRRHFVVRPGGSIDLPDEIPAGARLLERLERGVIGYHVATANSPTSYTINTPASVGRSYTVTSPKVVTNIRVWGAVDLEHALSHFTRDDESMKSVLNQGAMFITPPPQARLSRDRTARSDAMTEIQPGAVVRQLLMDGFHVYVILPAEKYGGAVGCVDRAQGPILRAVLQTFNGLKLPFTELASPNPFVAMLVSHGAARYDRANYVHEYAFEATAYLTDGDGIPPDMVPDLALIGEAIDNGDPIPTGPLQPIGTVPLDEIEFNPGIYHKGHPSPLQATVNFEE